MSRTTRRQFTQTIVAATAALPAIGLAQTAAPPPTTAKIAEEQQREPEKPNALGAALAGVVSVQSGQHLNESDMQRVYDDLQEYAPFVERFREYRLRNADEPDFTFHSLVDRW